MMERLKSRTDNNFLLNVVPQANELRAVFSFTHITQLINFCLDFDLINKNSIFSEAF